MVDTKYRKPRILIIDDEQLVRNLLREILSEDYDCRTVESAEQGLAAVQSEEFDLVLSDINLRGMSGIELIPQVLEASPDTVVMMISGNQTIDTAIEAMRSGAYDYIKKPFEIEHVQIAVDRALEHRSLLMTKRWYENHLERLVKEGTEKINYLAYYDALTGLPNRTLFEDRLSQSLILAEKEKQVAVIGLALDRFKKIQDTLGHGLGQSILQEVAGRLRNCCPDEVTAARLEGDEFAILLPKISGTQEIVELTTRISEALRFPISLDGNRIFITASIGISLSPDDGRDVQTLLKNAAIALSRAKEQGGDNYQFYTADMNAKAVKRLLLENNLRRALEREEFEVHYQPKIDVNTKRIVGMEALARWQCPELGLVSPMEFIPLAEESGLIFSIGEWVLRTACEQSRIWQQEGFPLHTSINLSPRQFEQPNLSKAIIQIIGETGFDSNCLELEVTESSIMQNADSVVQTLDELKEAGIKLSIDDFGTGYSSLAYLKRLPIDILKIDRSFIQDVTTNPDDATLVNAIITLAHNLGLKVVAEGVETEDQLKFLRLLKCDEWQGFLYSRPVASETFRELLLSADA